MVSTAHSYAALSRRLEGIAASDAFRVPAFCGYRKEDVARRFLQRCAELSVFKFTRAGAEHFHSTGALPGDGSLIDCDGLRFVGDKRVLLSARLFLHAMSEYVVLWTYALVMLLGAFRVTRGCRRVTLLYGVGTEDLLAGGSDLAFFEYVKRGPLTPLKNCDRLVIQATTRIRSSYPDRVSYGRVPLFIALKWQGLSPRVWLDTMRNHFRSVLSFANGVARFPALILLGRDAACHSIALALGRNDILKDVILTNTNYFSQALWMWALPNRTFSLNFAWYSQNNFPVVYRDDFIDAPISNLKFVSADIHWVWTCSFQRYLKQYVCAGARFNVVGPIIWRLRGKSLNVVERELMVAVFDVTPVDSMTENRLGLLRNYYSEENVSKFILDILGAVERVKSRIGKDIRVVLKHKRSHVSIHSKSYISLINGLVLNRKMEIFEPNGNIYNLLESCTAAVVLPFSSPAYVAQAVGKSAFWYDPLEKVLPLPFEDKIELIGGEKNLEVALSRVILD